MSATLRTVALALKARVGTMRSNIDPAWNEVESWILNDDDLSLPTVAQVKSVLAAYEAFEKPPLSLYSELREVKSAV